MSVCSPQPPRPSGRCNERARPQCPRRCAETDLPTPASPSRLRHTLGKTLGANRRRCNAPSRAVLLSDPEHAWWNSHANRLERETALSSDHKGKAKRCLTLVSSVSFVLKEPVRTTVSEPIDTVRGWVEDSSRIVALTGAGISTESG